MPVVDNTNSSTVYRPRSVPIFLLALPSGLYYFWRFSATIVTGGDRHVYYPFKDETQSAVYKESVRTAQ